jgi:DNA-binding transcriptional regulator YiaG
MSDHRTKARLIVNVFQSALRAKIKAENDFVLAHDQLGKLLDNLIAENEELRSVAECIEGTRQMRTEELNALRIKLGLIQAREVKP